MCMDDADEMEKKIRAAFKCVIEAAWDAELAQRKDKGIDVVVLDRSFMKD